MNRQENNDPGQQKPEYKKPELKRWGTLLELTEGGGGDKNEPTTKLRTRF